MFQHFVSFSFCHLGSEVPYVTSLAVKNENHMIFYEMMKRRGEGCRALQKRNEDSLKIIILAFPSIMKIVARCRRKRVSQFSP